MIKFEVFGNPKGKQRPRTCRIKGKTITYTPKQTKNYEKRVKACYKAVYKQFFDKNISVEVDIKAYFAIPKRISNKLKDEYLLNRRPVIKSPDADNISKIVCDALNGVAFFDDKQVDKLNVEKYWATIPKIVVELQERRSSNG